MELAWINDHDRLAMEDYLFGQCHAFLETKMDHNLFTFKFDPLSIMNFSMAILNSQESIMRQAAVTLCSYIGTSTGSAAHLINTFICRSSPLNLTD